MSLLAVSRRLYPACAAYFAPTEIVPPYTSVPPPEVCTWVVDPTIRRVVAGKLRGTRCNERSSAQSYVVCEDESALILPAGNCASACTYYSRVPE
jgi:hypothetical protein